MSTNQNNEIKTESLLSQTEITEARRFEPYFQLYRKELLEDRPNELEYLSGVEKRYKENRTPGNKLTRSIARAQVSCRTHILNGNKLLAEQQLKRLKDKFFILFDEMEDTPERGITITGSNGITHEGNKHEENLRQLGGAMIQNLNLLQNNISVIC